MTKAPKEERSTITTNINFDRDVWDWLNIRVAALKKSKSRSNKKDFIQGLIWIEMARHDRAKAKHETRIGQ